MLDDLLDVSGPAERTGKHRGTDLLDGTVTLPLILAASRPGAGRLDLRESLDAQSRRRRSATASPPRARWRKPASARGRWSREAKDALRGDVDPALERSLTDVADRIAERYA